MLSAQSPQTRKDGSPRRRFQGNRRRLSTSLSTRQDLYEDELEMKYKAPTLWDPINKRNSLCEYCNGMISFVPGIDGACRYCNVVAHIVCLPPEQAQLAFQNQWECTYCTDELKVSEYAFDVRLDNNRRKRLQRAAATMIVKNFLRFIHVKRYKYILSAIKKIQCLARIKYRKFVFNNMRQGKLRPNNLIVVKARDLAVANTSDMSTNAFLTVAVVDEHKLDKANWYYEVDCIGKTQCPNFNQSILLGGITGKQLLIFTVFHRGLKRNSMMGQATLHLSASNIWQTGATINLQLHEEEYNLKEFGAIQDYLIPQGYVTIIFEPLSGLRSDCGFFMGPDLDQYLGYAAQCKRNPALKIVRQSSKAKDRGSSQEDRVADDITTKIWVAVSDGLLYLYARFGGLLRAIIDMKYVSMWLNYVNVAEDPRKKRLAVHLRCPGIKHMNLTVLTAEHSWNWKFCFINCYKFARDPSIDFSLKNNKADMDRCTNDDTNNFKAAHTAVGSMLCGNTGISSPGPASPAKLRQDSFRG